MTIKLRNKHFLQNYIKINNLNNKHNAFLFACKKNHIEIVEITISDNKNSQDAMKIACFFGHLNIVKLLFFNDINTHQEFLNRYLESSCEGGNISVVEFIISCSPLNWNFGLFGACRGGHIDIVNLMISKGANRWDHALSLCFYSNNSAVFFLILNLINSISYYHISNALDNDKFNYVKAMILNYKYYNETTIDLHKRYLCSTKYYQYLKCYQYFKYLCKDLVSYRGYILSQLNIPIDLIN